jgi:predicted  nucleic acid-binding Zn-ribbon protein
MPAKQPLTSQEETPQEVDRIREILFGSQMRDYEQRFQVIRHDLERLQQELDRLAGRLAEQDSEQSKKLERLRKESREADEALRSALRETAQQLTNDKVDRMALGEMLIEMGNRLKAAVLASDLLQGLDDTTQG